MGTGTKRFRIAFSFAGEKRAFVARVARLLADRCGGAVILYDKYHEAEFAVYTPERLKELTELRQEYRDQLDPRSWLRKEL